MVRRAIKLAKGKIEREEVEILPESISSRREGIFDWTQSFPWHRKYGGSCRHVWRLDEEQGQLVAREVTGNYQKEARQVAYRLEEAKHELEGVPSSREYRERRLEPIRAHLRGEIGLSSSKLHSLGVPGDLQATFAGGKVVTSYKLKLSKPEISGFLKRKWQELESEILTLNRRQDALQSEIPTLDSRLREILSHMKREGWYRISFGAHKDKLGTVERVDCRVYMRPNVFEKAQVFERDEPLYLGTALLWKKEQEGKFWWYRDKFWVSMMYSEEEARLLLWEKGRREQRKFERLAKAKATSQQAREEAGRERIPEEIRLLVWERDGGRCVKCGSTEDLEFDHIIPVSKGGSNTEKNVQLLCATCNREKGGRIV